MTTATVVQVIFNCLMLSLFYILITTGLTLIFSIGGVLNFAHGEFYMLGGFVVYYLLQGLGINYIVCIVLAILILGLLGVGMEKAFFRPIRATPVSGLIVSLALLLLFEGSALIAFGPTERGVTFPWQGAVRAFGAGLSAGRLAIILSGILFMGVLQWFLFKTKEGLSIRAVAQDREAASLQGMSIDRTISLSFFIGCALAGAAGAIAVPTFATSPFVGFHAVLKCILVIIIGGLGSIPGAIVGGFILGSAEAIGYTLISNWGEILGFVIVIILLVVRPQGIMGIPHEH